MHHDTETATVAASKPIIRPPAEAAREPAAPDARGAGNCGHPPCSTRPGQSPWAGRACGAAAFLAHVEYCLARERVRNPEQRPGAWEDSEFGEQRWEERT